MKYSLGQLQAITGLPPDTLRHWRQVLPPLNGRTAHTPCFVASDLLALSVIQLLVKDFGFRVSALNSSAEELFDLCRGSNWDRLARGWLVFFPPADKWYFRTPADNEPEEQPHLNIPMGGLIQDLRVRLTSDSEAPQISLPLPPVAVEVATMKPR